MHLVKATMSNERLLVNTKQIGDIAEAKVIASILEKEYSVSIPWGDNQRYDCILDDGSHLYKVQIKTGRLREGSIQFNSSNGQVRRNYESDVDFFGVYCPDNDCCYLVPIEDVLNGGITYLRVGSNNRKGYTPKWAEHYQL